MDPNRITYFGETDFRNQKTRFGIKAIDRTKHVYVIGKSGMGKSTLLENMAVQDIQNGEGIALIDPHGGTAEKLLHYIPDSRINDVIYLAPFDLEYPISLNVMEDVGPDKRHLVASGLMSAFKKIWVDAWSARMEYILNNTILALLEYPGATLLSVNKMLSDKDFRKDVLTHVTDLSVKSFWVDEFAKYTERMAAEAVPAIQNKVGQFTANPVIRNIIGNPKSSFDFRDAMDSKKIVIINLSKGRLGEQNAALLGALIITKIYLAAMSRADAPESVSKNLPSFNFFVDEFQSFASDSFADILSEARKYKLCLHLAHQYVEQMSEQVKAAVLGNVGTMIVFRVGSTDALIFEKEFSPVFTAEDIVNLEFTQMYLRMTIDGIGSKPFSAKGLPVILPPAYSNKDQAIESSRKNYAKPRVEIEEIVKKLLETTPPPVKKTTSENTSGPTVSGKPNVHTPRPAGNFKNNTKPTYQNNKIREAFNNVVVASDKVNQKPAEKPVVSSVENLQQKNTDLNMGRVTIKNDSKVGLFAQLEEDVQNESAAVMALEKSYDNNFSTKFKEEINATEYIKPIQDSNNQKNNFNSFKTGVNNSKSGTSQGFGKPFNNNSTKPLINQKPKIHSYSDKGAKPESMSALKDFLNKVVSSHQNSSNPDSINVAPKEQLKSEPDLNDKSEISQNIKPVINPEVRAQVDTKSFTENSSPKIVEPVINRVDLNQGIKEVPEDVLKRILNQD